MKLKLIFTALLSLSMLLATGCKKEDEPKASAPSDVRQVNTQVGSAVNEAMQVAMGGSRAIVDSGTFNGAGFSYSYTVDQTSNYSATYNGTMTFNNFYRNEVTVNGSLTLNMSLTISSDGNSYSLSLNYKGKLTADYQGTTYAFVYDLSASSNGSNTTVSGGVTVNGTYYPASSFE